MRILLAEDTKDMNRAVTVMLEHAGYAVDPVYDGGAAWEALRQNVYDGVILDIMMPVMSGLEVLNAARQSGIDTPVLLLTAKAEIDDRVDGLDAGANDYLTKPFAMKELLARVRTMLRTYDTYHEPALTFADLKLDAEAMSLTAENSIHLSRRECALLKELIVNRDRELSTEYRLEHNWRDDPSAGADEVWLYISYLNGKLESIASSVKVAGEQGGSFHLITKS